MPFSAERVNAADVPDEEIADLESRPGPVAPRHDEQIRVLADLDAPLYQHRMQDVTRSLGNREPGMDPLFVHFGDADHSVRLKSITHFGRRAHRSSLNDHAKHALSGQS